MKRFFVTTAFAIGVLLVTVNPADAATKASPLTGRILLQVQDKGQAWYVNPADKRAYYMGRPSDAFALMKRLGVGITDANLRKLPIATLNAYGTPDADHDGLSDAFEQAYGSNMNNADTDSDGYADWLELNKGYSLTGHGRAVTDMKFANAQKGKILLQVQQGGAAWYVNPVDLKAYYLGKPADALNVMRKLGLGVTNKTLYRIPGVISPVTDHYSIRIFNVDDVGTAVINGSTLCSTTYTKERVEDITNAMHSGTNTINLKMYNNAGPYTWGFEIKKNGQVIFSEHAGIVGVMGANNNDITRTYQTVYDKVVTITKTGAVTVNGYQAPSPTIAPAHRWYVRQYNGDDKQSMVVNNQYTYNTAYFGQDSGFIDVTNLIHTGKNTIDLKTWNDNGGYAFGFQIKRDDSIVFDEKGGTAGTVGAYDNDTTKNNQYVYNKTVTVDDNGVVGVTSNLPYPTPHWYIRMFNGDDQQSMSLNNRYTYKTDKFAQDSGFIDITPLMLRTGSNTIDFKTWNGVAGYAWGFQVKKDDMIVFDDKGGNAGTIGAYNNDHTKQNQYIFNKSVTISDTGLVSVRNNIGF